MTLAARPVMLSGAERLRHRSAKQTVVMRPTVSTTPSANTSKNAPKAGDTMALTYNKKNSNRSNRIDISSALLRIQTRTPLGFVFWGVFVFSRSFSLAPAKKAVYVEYTSLKNQLEGDSGRFDLRSNRRDPCRSLHLQQQQQQHWR